MNTYIDYRLRSLFGSTRTLPSVLAILCCCLSFPSGAATQGNDTKALSIFVSILPQKYLVQRIGQQHVVVSTMVGPGHSPATYEPTPKQMALLGSCDAYFRIGVPFEAMWIDKIAQANSRLRIFDMQSSPRDLHHHAEHEGIDPHVWTDPVEVKQLAQQTAHNLAQLDPTHQAEFAANLLRLENDLNDLDQFIRKTVHDNQVKQFMVYHPAWGHFAQEYGLIQIAIEKDGKEPGAKALAQLIETAKTNHIQRIFVQKQFNRRSADIIAQAIHAQVVIVDPLAENLIDNIRDFTLKLAQGS